MNDLATHQEGRQSRPYKDIAAQLRVECRRATAFEQRAARAERAERDLAAELQRARERITDLLAQVGVLTASLDRAATLTRAIPRQRQASDLRQVATTCPECRTLSNGSFFFAGKVPGAARVLLLRSGERPFLGGPSLVHAIPR